MDLSAVQNIGTILIPLVLLLFADAITGSIKAFTSPGSEFKWEWLYVFGRTKGTPLVTGAIFLAMGELSVDVTTIGAPIDFFTVTGMGILAPLGVSLIASIGNNLKPDVPDSNPQGVPSEAVVIAEASTDPVLNEPA